MGFAGRRFRPTLWFTVFAVVGVGAMLALSAWQLQRLEWKEALIAERQARPQLPPLELHDLLAIENAAPFEFRRARVTGMFLHDKEMHLLARSMNGNVGIQVVTPFVLVDGPTILINRGWVPNEFVDPATRRDGLIEGVVTIEALVRGPGIQHWLVADNEPDKNVWYWMDLPVMRAAAGLSPAGPPLYLEALADQHAGEFPIGGQSRLELPNDHLQYAVTWFLLAVVLTVIWFFYHWRREDADDAPSAGGGQDGGTR